MIVLPPSPAFPLVPITALLSDVNSVAERVTALENLLDGEY